MRTSGLLLLVGSAAAANARVAGVVTVVAGELVGAAVEVVEAVEVVAVVGVVMGVGALVAAVVAAVGVAVVAAVGVVAVGLELLSVERGASGSSGSCPYVIRTGVRAGQTCGKPHTQHRFFSRLDDAWRAKFGDEAERPRRAELLRSGVAIFDLDYDAILAAMYALSISAEGDCYLCVPPDPGIEAAALGASEPALPGTAPAEDLHTFTLDSGASCYFFRDSTTLTPLSAPVPVRLADPSGGSVLARSSTVLPCPAVPSDSLSGLHLPSSSTNLVSTAALQDAMVTTTTPGGQRVSICTCTRTGRHLATFIRRPGSSLYILATEPPQVAASAQVSAPGPSASRPCSPASRPCCPACRPSLLPALFAALYLLSDSRDSVLLFDHTTGAAPAPPATADSATRSHDARYRAALPAEFLDRNPPPMYTTLYFIVTRLPDSLRAVRDHFLALDPTAFTVDLLEKHHLAVETSVVAEGAARGTPRTPFFEGCPPSPLAPSYASAAAVDVLGAEDVRAASTSGKHHSSKGKVGRGGGDGSGGGQGGSSGGGGGSGGGGSGGSDGGSGGFGGGGGCSGGSGGSGRGGSGSGRAGAQRGEFGNEAERPHWAELLRSRVAIFDLDYDAILAAMYALSVSAEGDCYISVPPDPGIEAAALGAGESFLPGTARAEALHTFTLDSGASRCFFHDSTTLTPLSSPVPIRLADPSGGSVLARSSTVLPCPAVPSGSLSGLHLPSFSTNLVSTAALQDAMVTTTTPGGQRVTICTYTRTGRHLATFTRRLGSSLYTLATKPPQVAASAQVSASGQVAPPCSCRLLSHQTLLWYHRLGHLSLPRVCGIHSRLLVSGLPRPGGAKPGGAEPGGAESEGAGSGGAKPADVEPSGAEPEGVEPGGAESEGAESGGAKPRVTASSGSPAAAGAGDSAAGDPGGGGAAAAGPGGARTRGAGAGDPTEPGAAGAGGAGAGGIGARGAGAGGAGAGGAGAGGTGAGGTGAGGARAIDPGAVDPGAGGSGITVRPRPYFIPLLQQVLGVPSSIGLTLPLLCPPPDQSQPPLQPASPLCVPPYTEQTGGLTERRAPASRPVSEITSSSPWPQAGSSLDPLTLLLHLLPCLPQALCASASATSMRDSCSHKLAALSGVSPSYRSLRLVNRRDPCPRPPPVPGTRAMALRPSSVPLCVPLPPPPESSFLAVPDPESDRTHAANPTVSRLLATVVTDPFFESTAASALIAELVDFAAACRLDYAAALVAESEFAKCLAATVPRFASMLLAPEGDPYAPDIPTPRSYAEAIMGFYSSQWQAAMDVEMASWKSTGTYVDVVPPSRANIVDGMWIFWVKWPPGSPPAFKAPYVARGFSQRHGVNYFHTFSPTPKMSTLRVLLHVAAQRDYELHSLDFSTAFLQGSLHEEIWLRRPPGFTGSFPAGTQWSLRRQGYGLRRAPREWHDTLRTTLAALGFARATADPSLFLRTDTSLLPFYVLVYVEDLVFTTADTEALTLVKSELQKRHTCTDLGELRSYLGLQITRDRARRTITLTQSHMVHQVLQRFGFQFSSPQPTPLFTGHSLSAPPLDESVEPTGPYLELVGCLMYLMTCTRPDLAYPLSLLARYVAPGRHRKVHWDAAKRVLRYLCSTSGMGLVLGGRGPVVLTSHVDTSLVDDSATQRSSQGYTFSLGFGSVSWRSTRSSSVLSSSCEAEIYAGAMAAQELR
ncbi:unnamed protein product [Closterium sp. NIES-53]